MKRGFTLASIIKEQSFKTVLAVAIGTFMSALDTSIVNVAVPVIQNHFQVSLSMVEWVVTAYLLIISSLLLTFGRFADLYGQKRIYLAGMGIFTLASLFCSLSVNLGMLIISRIIQAVGAGMMFSSGPAIITNSVPAANRGQALSFSSIAVAVALCTGPVLGGFLVTATGWQSIFYINVPVGILAAWIALKNIPADTPKAALPFDIPGSLLIFTALILILFPLDLTGKSGLSPLVFYGMLGMGLFVTLVFIRYEQKAAHPLLNMTLFENRLFAFSNLAAILNFMAQFIMIFLVPFYLQKLRQFSPAYAGVLYIPMPLTTLIVAPVSGTLSDRFDSRLLSSAGMGIMALGLFLLSFLGPATPVSYIMMAMAISGLGSGFFQTPNNSAIMGSVPPQYRGTASGTLATMRNIGMVLGVAVSGALFTFQQNQAQAHYQAQGLHGLALHQAIFVQALHFTFSVAGVIAILAMFASLARGTVRSTA